MTSKANEMRAAVAAALSAAGVQGVRVERNSLGVTVHGKPAQVLAALAAAGLAARPARVQPDAVLVALPS